jgi:hypothetical protein
MSLRISPAVGTCHLWLPGYLRSSVARVSAPPPTRIWVSFADHFEPWWRRPDTATALERVARWVRGWPDIAARHADHTGRQPCYTFFYPEEQYHPRVMDDLRALRERGIGDVEVHLHHDNDTPQAFVDRLSVFLERLDGGHGLLRRENARVTFGFIHGNWALDNSLPNGRHCGLNNEITLLRDLGCYADFTLPAVPSPAQPRMINTLYWATDDPVRPKSHDVGVPVRVGAAPTGDLLMVPGPLTVNVREWRTPGVPRIEIGELAGHCVPTRHRARLWVRAAPRLANDVFVKLFAHGAPEKNASALLEPGQGVDFALTCLEQEAGALGARLFFVSAWEMTRAIGAVRRGDDPVVAHAGARTHGGGGRLVAAC